MNIIQQAKAKLKPPPPPAKPSHLTQSSSQPSQSSPSSPPSVKRGLGWPWDYQPTLYPLFFGPDLDPGSGSKSEPGSSSPPSHPRHVPTWLFNWELWVPASLPTNVDWTPCVRTAAQTPDIIPFLTDITTNQGRTVTHLLGFNEPEIPSQANLSVVDAVQLWKDTVLPARRRFPGLKLGSPGMSSDVSLSIPWLDEFFARLGGIGPHGGAEIEFLVLHWYGLRFEDMRSFLETMHDRYRLPVWVNEFACSTMAEGQGQEASQEQVETFLTQAIPWLDACGWVERYAYFGNGQGMDVGSWVGRNSNFTEEIENGGGGGGERRLTRIGELYLTL